MNLIVKDCLRGAKSLSQLHMAIVKLQTKGNVFRWHGEANADSKIEAARKQAEETAIEWIRESLDEIPKRVKRDMALGR